MNGEKEPKVCGGMMRKKLWLGERRLFGRSYGQKTDVQKLREKKRERLKGVYIRAKRK